MVKTKGDYQSINQSIIDIFMFIYYNVIFTSIFIEVQPSNLKVLSRNCHFGGTSFKNSTKCFLKQMRKSASHFVGFLIDVQNSNSKTRLLDLMVIALQRI